MVDQVGLHHFGQLNWLQPNPPPPPCEIDSKACIGDGEENIILAQNIEWSLAFVLG